MAYLRVKLAFNQNSHTHYAIGKRNLSQANQPLACKDFLLGTQISLQLSTLFHLLISSWVETSLFLPFFWVVFNLSLTVLGLLSVWKRYFGFEDGSPFFGQQLPCFDLVGSAFKCRQRDWFYGLRGFHPLGPTIPELFAARLFPWPHKKPRGKRALSLRFFLRSICNPDRI